jgi:hypothetical protein
MAATTMVMIGGCGSALPEVRVERLTPKPMKVAMTGFSFNRFYAVEGKENASVIPISKVDQHYATFRKTLGEQTASHFALVDDAAIKANPTYQSMLPNSAGGKVMEKLAAASPDGMVLGRPQDVESSKLCQDLGVDGVLWVHGTLTQVVGAFAIGGLGNFALRWDADVALIGKDGVVWHDVVSLKSDKTFAAAGGLASTDSLDEATTELAPKIAAVLAQRLNQKAGP